MIAPSGARFVYPAHASDVLRTQLIVEFGGIYLDADVIVLKSFDPLRNYTAVIGREREDGLCNGILIAERGATYMKMLLVQYNNYSKQNFTETWDYRSVLYPNILAARYSHLVHVEEATMHRPNWRELHWIYVAKWNWSNNYAMHLWIRLYHGHHPTSAKDIDCLTSTFGEVCRHAYYGTSEMLFCPTVAPNVTTSTTTTRATTTQTTQIQTSRIATSAKPT
jgi:hypothetical protein